MRRARQHRLEGPSFQASKAYWLVVVLTLHLGPSRRRSSGGITRLRVLARHTLALRPPRDVGRARVLPGVPLVGTVLRHPGPEPSWDPAGRGVGAELAAVRGVEPRAGLGGATRGVGRPFVGFVMALALPLSAGLGEVANAIARAGGVELLVAGERAWIFG